MENVVDNFAATAINAPEPARRRSGSGSAGQASEGSVWAGRASEGEGATAYNAPKPAQSAVSGSAALAFEECGQAGRNLPWQGATACSYFPDDAAAAARFETLAEEMLCGDGTLRPQHAVLIANVVRSEYLAEKLRNDIEKRGMGEMARNGRQSYWRENKSVGTLMKLMEQQRRTLQALGLIARGKDQSGDADDDDGDFDKF